MLWNSLLKDVMEHRSLQNIGVDKCTEEQSTESY